MTQDSSAGVGTAEDIDGAAPISNTSGGFARSMKEQYPLSFTGQGGEYFRIWIVNIALTIVTFGIYSAWATVRTRRYFYGNTHLDGTPFQFTAKPIPILIGRIIAAVLFLIYNGLALYNPAYALGYLFLIILPLMPWMVMKSLQFKARYTRWRNIAFSFDGGYWRAVLVYFLLPIVVGLTGSIMLPYFWERSAKYQFGNMRYGSIEAGYKTKTTGFWSTYGWAALMVLVAYLLLIAGFMLVIPSLQDFDVEQSGMFGMPTLVLALLPLIYIAGFMITFFVRGRLFNASLMHVFFGNRLNPKATLLPSLPVWGFAWLLLTNLFLIVITLGLFWPWAKVREARYKIEHLAIASPGPLDFETISEEAAVGATGAELAGDFGFEFSLF